MLTVRRVVIPLRVVLVLLFGILVVFQTLSLPGQFAYMAGEAPDIAYLRWPLTAVTVFWVLCVQVVIVCAWQLLTLVKDDRIFSEASMAWVDAIVWAVAGAWVTLLAVAFFVAAQVARPRAAPPAVADVVGGHRARAPAGGAAGPAATGHRAADRHGSGDLMPIVVRIDVELAKRKMSVGEFADRVGLTPANVAVLKNGRAKAVRFSTLESICRVLDCQPGDLLEWVEQDEVAVTAS